MVIVIIMMIVVTIKAIVNSDTNDEKEYERGNFGLFYLSSWKSIFEGLVHFKRKL